MTHLAVGVRDGAGNVVAEQRELAHDGAPAEQVQAGDSRGLRIYTEYSVYSYNYWEYDAAAHQYVRYQEANDMDNQQPRAYAPLTDALTGQPVTSNNIVALFVPHTFASQSEADDQVYHIEPVGSGRALVFRDGAAFPARWYRLEIDQPLLLTDEAGVPVYLRPGRTFYQVIGESSTYVEDGADWHFTFQIP